MTSSEYDFFFVVFNNLTEDVKIKSILELSHSTDIVNIGMVDQFIVVFIADFGNKSLLEFPQPNFIINVLEAWTPKWAISVWPICFAAIYTIWNIYYG